MTSTWRKITIKANLGNWTLRRAFKSSSEGTNMPICTNVYQRLNVYWLQHTKARQLKALTEENHWEKLSMCACCQEQVRKSELKCEENIMFMCTEPAACANRRIFRYLLSSLNVCSKVCEVSHKCWGHQRGYIAQLFILLTVSGNNEISILTSHIKSAIDKRAETKLMWSV